MGEENHKTGNGHEGEDHPLVGHVVPLWLLLGVGAALIFLTVVTVAVTYVDLGRFNLFVALVIAGIKALMVCLYFMHLRWDRIFNGFIFMGAVVFVILFIGFAMMDSLSYQPDIKLLVESSVTDSAGE